MRAIIISDADARALLDKLELRSLHADNILREDPARPPTVSDIHRAFHYVVTRWLQEQGADCVGR
jgi:hypothetical protein